MDTDQLKTFYENGFVVIKGILSPSVLESLKHGSDALVDDLADRLVAESVITDKHVGDPFETRLINLIKNHEDEVPLLYRKELHKVEFYDLFCNEKIISCVRQILNKADALRIFPNYSLRPKLPNLEAHEIVWHQDAGITADGSPSEMPVAEREDAYGINAMVNCWAPLVPATEETGCMLCIPGSHKLGIQKHELLRRYRPQEETVSYSLYAAQIESDVIKRRENERINMECEPGDVILFSNLLFHRGGFNKSGIVRWSFDWRYQDASKPTRRSEKGHLMWAKDSSLKTVQSPSEWAELCLS